MARGMRWWLGGTALACAVVALVYLPPHSTPLRHGRFAQFEPLSPYRLREQGLAARWRDAVLELKLLRARDRLRAELARRAALDLPGYAILFLGPDTLPPPARAQIAAEVDTIWNRLGIGVPKVSLGLVLQVGRQPRSGDRPVFNSVNAYLLPDSSDRRTCMAFFVLPVTWSAGRLLVQGRPAPHGELRPLVQDALGPCAFYAAFGTPGRPVAAWLAARHFDLALYPWWDHRYAGRFAFVPTSLDAGRDRMFMMQVYSFGPTAVACIGGRPVACRAAVLRDAGRLASPRRLVTPERRWWRRAMPGAGHYLADVAREVGRDRFRRFWNSDLPVDTALAAVLRRPTGLWTRQWEAQLVPAIRLGPAASLTDALLTLAGIAAVLLALAATVRHREVG